VHHLAAKQDFRLRALTKAAIYLQAQDAETAAKLDALFSKLASGPVRENAVLTINGRQLPALAVAGSVARFSFAQLCESNRSAEDYIELAREFQTIILENVPLLGNDQNDAARRLVFLVDELYDRRVNLILSAASAPSKLYSGHRLQFEFQRAASRLIEMQTEEYLSAAHKH
jgi:cell division protein ZapE